MGAAREVLVVLRIALRVIGHEQVFPAGKVVVERAFGKIEAREHALHRKSAGALCCEDLARHPQDLGFTFCYLNLLSGE